MFSARYLSSVWFRETKGTRNDILYCCITTDLIMYIICVWKVIDFKIIFHRSFIFYYFKYPRNIMSVLWKLSLNCELWFPLRQLKKSNFSYVLSCFYLKLFPIIIISYKESCINLYFIILRQCDIYNSFYFPGNTLKVNEAFEYIEYFYA